MRACLFWRSPANAASPAPPFTSASAHISITLKDPQLLKQTVEELRKIPEIVEAHFITGKGNILVKLYCVDNEHLMRTIFDGILRIQGIATTETNISLQEVFQREVNIDFIDE